MSSFWHNFELVKTDLGLQSAQWQYISFEGPIYLQVYMEPLKKVQVEGYIMMAEPEMLFGNLDELCCVSQKNEIQVRQQLLKTH